MGPIKSEYACPTCKQNGLTNQIYASAGELYCSAFSEHRWRDTQSFLDMRPKMEFKVEVARNLPQQNYTPVTLSVPLGLVDALTTKLGDKDKVSATMVSILLQMLEGNILIIGQTDIDRITSRLGSEPKNSSELFGMIFAKTEEIAEHKMLREAAEKDLKAYEGISPGRVVVDLGDQFQNAVDKARGAELPLKVLVENSLRNGLENGWF